MAECLQALSSSSSLSDNLISFWLKWKFAILPLLTMSLQLFLVLVGFIRKRSPNPLLHASLWLAFISIDACVVYALGLMLASGCGNIFSLYAPILLYHVGATDVINAYSSTDNDFWHRYGLIMVIETIVAAYIVSQSSQCPNVTVASVMLFIVGSFKYGERIYALRSGSQAQILASSRPIYNYMTTLTLDEKSVNHLVVYGEEWYAQKNGQSSQKPVTCEDIQNCKSLPKVMGVGVIERICFAYALFKVFRRRLANLPIHQKKEDYDKVKLLLTNLKAEEIRKVIDIELSFIFDGIFSKASAGRLYQGIGVITRLVSLVFLFMAFLAILVKLHDCDHETIEVPFALGFALLFVIIAIVIECLQICRVVRSNWLRVWLACNYVMATRINGGQQSSNENNAWSWLHHFNENAITYAFQFVGKPRKAHWNFRLQQLSITVESLSLMRKHYLCKFDIGSMCDTRILQKEISNLLIEPDLEHLQSCLIKQVMDKHKTILDGVNGHSHDQIALEIDPCGELPFLKKETTLENFLLECHLMTSQLEIELLNIDDCKQLCEDPNVKMSIWLSRYCMYVALRKPQLVPEDPDVVKELYSSAKNELKDRFLERARSPKGNLRCALGPDLYDLSGCDLRKVGQKLAKVWLRIFICIIMDVENARPHIELMAKGGELLTHFWVLLGHIAPSREMLEKFKMFQFS